MDKDLGTIINTESRWKYLCLLLEGKSSQLENQLRAFHTLPETKQFDLRNIPIRQFVHCYVNVVSISNFVEALSKVNHQAVLLIHAWLCEDTYKTNNNDNHIPLQSKEVEELYRQGMELYWLQNFEESVQFLEKAALQLYPAAFLQLAALCVSSYGIYKQYDVLTTSMIESKFCKDFFINKALSGNPVDQNHLAWYYQYVEVDYAECLHWHLKAAEQNYGPSLNTIGILIETRKVHREERSVYWYQKAADVGFCRGHVNLAYCYGHGDGVAYDHAKAMYWYQKAADQGHAYSMYAIGHFNETDGHPKLALHWYQKSAAVLEENALFRLAKVYFNGQLGMQVDIPAGLAWLKKSLDRCSSHGQYFMGKLLMKGKYVKRDYQAAVGWFEKGVEKNRIKTQYPKSQYRLGLCYYHGLGVPQNYEKAAELFANAHKKNLDKATQMLARCYEYGEGVKQDINKALKLYEGANLLRLRLVTTVQKCCKEEE